MSKIVSGCLEDIFIFISGYSFLNFDIIGDKNWTANVSPVEILISPEVVVLFCFKSDRKFWLVSFCTFKWSNNNFPSFVNSNPLAFLINNFVWSLSSYFWICLTIADELIFKFWEAFLIELSSADW